MSLQFVCAETEMEPVLDAILGLIDNGKCCFLLKGDLGAGKTTLVKKIAAKLGIRDDIQSPTFSIVNQYAISPERWFVHCDWYRVESESELIEIGMEEYLSNNNIVFIEWPEMGRILWPEDAVVLNIEHIQNNLRQYNIFFTIDKNPTQFK